MIKMIEQFNDMATVFLTKMEKTFPQEKKIKAYKIKYTLLRETYPKKPIEMFMESMYDYGEQILTRDEKFFKQDQFVNKAESISEKMGLVQYWDSMSPATQKAIWEYITGLYILGMAIFEKNDELQELITKTGFTGI